ncbi:hypothetical protein B0I35DRAFT_417916 [Stachybotrys elegans]|uniref:Secreted protein n=1 Tax=Stachybotrys elegans TaxID=80388 RepID=A0A8K0T1W5_9HYPO|nr:hypothetical protein B0I35DRAFT_417916 [Stachybotrys elegans]
MAMSRITVAKRGSYCPTRLLWFVPLALVGQCISRDFLCIPTASVGGARVQSRRWKVVSYPRPCSIHIRVAGHAT